MAYYTYADGNVPTSAQWNANVRDRVVTDCTAATRPTAVNGMIIYETDTNETLVYYSGPAQWRRPWRMPWGYLAVGIAAADVTTAGTTPSTIITTSTFTTPANRRTRASLGFSGFGSVAADTFEIKIFGAAGGTLIGKANIQVAGAGTYTPTPVTFMLPDTPASGAGTDYRATITRTAGTGTFTVKADSTFDNYLLVEDIGPNGAPA